jgi:hypothetical protein
LQYFENGLFLFLRSHNLQDGVTSIAEGRGACVRLHPAQEGVVWNLVSALGGLPIWVTHYGYPIPQEVEGLPEIVMIAKHTRADLHLVPPWEWRKRKSR